MKETSCREDFDHDTDTDLIMDFDLGNGLDLLTMMNWLEYGL